METIFERRTLPVRPKIEAAPAPEKTEVSVKKRRSDSKHNIKVKLNHEDRKLLKLRALDRMISLTAFCSELVKISIVKEYEPPKVTYGSKGEFINVILEDDYFESIQRLSVEWDLNYREVVYQYIKHYIALEKGEILITHYRDSREGQ